MRIVIYGAGGIGGTIGARLWLADHEVLLIARGTHGATIQERGLRFVAPNGVDDSLAIPCVLHPRDVDWRADDVVMLCMKGQHTESALDDLAGSVQDVPIVCAQNGVANERVVGERFERVIAMVVYLPALHLEPGVVVTQADGLGGVLDCGTYRGGHEVGQVCDELAQRLTDAGFSCRHDPQVMRWKYAKLLANMANAVQATLGVSSAHRELLSGLRKEALACYAAAGIDCATRDEVKARLADTYRMVDVDGVPRGGGSTWQSVARGTGNVETDYLNGEIVRLGQQHGVATPLNRAVMQTMQLALQRGYPAGETPMEVFEELLA